MQIYEQKGAENLHPLSLINIQKVSEFLTLHDRALNLKHYVRLLFHFAQNQYYYQDVRVVDWLRLNLSRSSLKAGGGLVVPIK